MHMPWGIALFTIAVVIFSPSGQLWQAFQAHVHLSPSELSIADRGDALSKLLPAADAREMAAFGMVQVNTTADTLAARFRDIANFKKSEQILEIGKFATRPTVQDLKGLTLDEAELAAIKSCEVGRCDLRLSGEMIARLRRGAPGDVAALFRQILVDYVNAYAAGGSAALIRYEDKSPSVSLATDFQGLLGASRYLRDYAPEFAAYLQSYPQNKPQGAEDFFYWSKEKFGVKPVISLTHVFMYRRPDSNDLLIVSKQIFATHYFDSSMGITALVAGSETTKFYLIYLNRSRVDALGGMFGGVLSSLIRRQIENGLVTNLKLTKQRLETGLH